MGDLAPYAVLSELHHDHVVYAPGSTVRLDPAGAEALLAIGAVAAPGPQTDTRAAGAGAPEPARSPAQHDDAPGEAGEGTAARLPAEGNAADTSSPAAAGEDGPLSGEAALVAAIRGLDRADPSLWTKGGRPQVRALEAVLGRDVTVAQRDAAWTAAQAERPE